MLVVGSLGYWLEVWLDGMEITQFTYFQQCGGLDCRPVSIEITYGLETGCIYSKLRQSLRSDGQTTITYGASKEKSNSVPTTLKLPTRICC